MLSFLNSSKSDSPLADAKRLEERLRLLPRDPVAAVEEGIELLDAVANDLPPGKRIEASIAIDAAIQPIVRKLMREFCSRGEDSAQAERLWIVVRRFWHQSASAPSDLIEAQIRGDRGADAARRDQPLLAVRAARAWNELGRWCHLTYGPHESTLWPRLAAVYQLALDRGFAASKLAPLPRSPIMTSVEAEVQRLAVFWASAPARLPARRIDPLDRIIASIAPHFEWTQTHHGDVVAAFDARAGRAPGRSGPAMAGRSDLRFIAGRRAVTKIDEFLGSIARDNALPAQLDALAGVPIEDVTATLAHLREQWAQPLRTRRHARHPLASNVAVADGFAGLVQRLAEGDADAALDFARGEVLASWRTVDVSAGGLAAVAHSGDAGLAIDTLKAIRPAQSERWQAAIVRRLERVSGSEVVVAMETMGTASCATDLVVVVEGVPTSRPEQAVLLGHPAGGGALRVIVAAGVHAAGNTYRLTLNARTYFLQPRGELARGPGYELLDCLVRTAD